MSDKEVMDFDVDQTSIPVNEDDGMEEETGGETSWKTYMPEVEVISDDDDGKPPAEIQSRIDSLEAELKAARDREDPGSKIDKAFEKLADRLDNVQGKQQEEQIENIVDFKKKLGDSFYNDPVKSLDSYFDRRLKDEIVPAYQQMANQLTATTTELSKEKAAQTETGKLVFENYAGEVEKLVKEGKVQFGSNMYKEAVQRVASDHLDEIIEMKMKSVNKTQKEPKNASPSATARVTKPTKIKINSSVESTLREEAKQLGVPFEKHVAYVKRKHPNRLKGAK